MGETMNRRVCHHIFLAAALAATAGAARAQGLDGERFAPAAGAAGGFAVERPAVPGHLGYGLGLFLHLADDALVVRDRPTGEPRSQLLDTAFSLDLIGSIGLFDRFELGVHLPLRLVYDGEADTIDGGALAAASGLGDVRLVPKLILLHDGDESSGFLLGLAAPVSLPTGTAAELRGAGGATVEPRLLAMGYGQRWYLGGSAGFRLRAREADYAPGHEVTFGGAFTYRPAIEEEWIDVQVEALGGLLPGVEARALSNLPLEVLGGLILRPAARWSIYAGAGLGVTNGIAVPDFRVIAGVRYAVGLPTRGGKKDGDGDGITDRQDRCSGAAEDLDGFEDDDGCPEADNDQDGIGDDDDECPDDAEEPGGDRDGCPDRARIVLRKGRVQVYGKVLFRTGSADISPKSELLLDDMARLIQEHRQIKRLEIQGHTDSTGDAAYNLKLSQERAQTVRAALIKRGVSERRLVAKGYGETQPIAPNLTNAGRAKNRRVEFAIPD
jgi:outer membrane protein OmpA-like peptidoglycan-associated protein